MRHREDALWIEQAVRWLSLRGRRVVVRTRVVMSRALVDALVRARDQAGAIVELELAHHKAAIQRALLGEHADPCAALLLQAQHLETLEIPVVGRLAPMLPGIHDQPNGFGSLLRNLSAADLHQVVVQAGRLHGPQIADLIAATSELSVAGRLELARAYGVDPMIFLGSIALPPEQSDAVFKLKPRRAQVLRHGLEAMAREAGMEVLGSSGSCCEGYCDLLGARVSTRPSTERAGNSPVRAGYESVMGRDLFAGLEL